MGLDLKKEKKKTFFFIEEHKQYEGFERNTGNIIQWIKIGFT